MKNAFIDLSLEHESYTDILKYLKKDNKIIDNAKNDKTAFSHKAVLCAGVIDTQKSHLIYSIKEHSQRPVFIITASELKAKEFYEDIRYFNKRGTFFYPSKDAVFYSADVRSSDIEKKRFAVMDSLIRGEDTVVVLSVEALFDKLTPREFFVRSIRELEVADAVDLDELVKHLVHIGYERADTVELQGQFALRGGILDIFVPTTDNPYRIEFFGDEVDSIRVLDITTQRSVEKADRIRIFPMREMISDEKTFDTAIEMIKIEVDKIKKEYREKGYKEEADTLTETYSGLLEKLQEHRSITAIDSLNMFFHEQCGSLLDYMPKDSIIIVDEPTRVSAHAETVYAEFNESTMSRIQRGQLLPVQSKMLFSYEEVLDRIMDFSHVLLTSITHTIHDYTIGGVYDFLVKSSGVTKNRLDILTDDFKYYTSQKYRILFLAGAKSRAERLAEELNRDGIPAQYYEDLEDKKLTPGIITISKGSMTRGFEYPHIKFILLTDKELFGEEKPKKKSKKKNKTNRIDNFADLRPGDYVVHDSHGIGVYRGIEKIIVDGISKDYLKISYQDGGNLFVHTQQLDLLQKYIGGDEGKPRLNKLGGSDWEKTKSRVRSAVKIAASELIELYAKRQAAVGNIYSQDTVWQKEFEDMFPFEETDDQLQAIEDVKADMQSGLVMDRLICGDVGYGKTEIAIRAAFKAVQDNKQVAYLVPTTILAQQHYNTFKQRMKDYPINIEMMSRFRTQKQMKQTMDGLTKGSVDITIGTHRLLSKDIKFKDLGLIIVDEEQRFGVTHKEKLKKIKENVDVITLTATPIPRTLHMSLIGIRDMSVLEEPPQERKPVQTYVMEYSPEFVKDAIKRELARNGQVYYLHNRVRNIADVCAKVQQLVPEANVAFAHGQMSEHELENIMMDFIDGTIDVLVCTTIIETGLDISNVNTIIIQDADHMGLSQLYQLRGRVGRSNRISYAYLMYKKDKVLSETSEKRLQTIREYTDFGSGYKIAMRDLEIRGAGNLLGGEQHGHMEAVGYETYCKLLQEAVNEMKGIIAAPEFETTVDVSIDAFLPSFYIENEEQKLDVYKKIAQIKNHDDYIDMYDEIVDRFGDLPSSVSHLLDVAYLKAVAHSKHVVSVMHRKNGLVISFKPDADLDPASLMKLVSENKDKLTFSVSPNPLLIYKINAEEEKTGHFLINAAAMLAEI